MPIINCLNFYKDGLTEEQLIVFKKQADEESANNADRLLNDLLEYKKRVVQDIVMAKHFKDVEIAIVEVHTNSSSIYFSNNQLKSYDFFFRNLKSSTILNQW